jgi:hypothetical protein
MKKPVLLILSLSLIISYSYLCGENYDEYISRKIREDLSSPSMDNVMEGFNRLGSREVAAGILVSLYTLGNENVRESTKLSTFSIAGATATCVLLKLIVNRDRPNGDNNRINSSFPSGHATGAFAFTYVMSKRHPKTTIPLYLAASTIAFSRVYLGRHYLSDAVAGSIIGITAGWIVIKNEETLLKVGF